MYRHVFFVFVVVLGHYMYIETSFPRVPGDYAELLSSTYLPPRRANGKMTFAYHMSGATIGNLSVFGLPTGSSRRTLLWSLAGNQGTAWKTASVVISFKTSYQVSTVQTITALQEKNTTYFAGPRGIQLCEKENRQGKYGPCNEECLFAFHVAG